MRREKYTPKDTTIELEFLDTKRKTIMEFSRDKVGTKEDDWKVAERSTARSSEPWKGRTVFRILAGGKPNFASG